MIDVMNEVFTTYLLALEVEPMVVGQAYVQLPMHCTAVHRFHSKLSPEELTESLRPVFKAAQPIELVPQEHKAFGPKQQLVTVLKPTKAIVALHRELYEALNMLGVQYTERDWVGEGYTPHVTDKKGKRLQAKPTLTTQVVYLISVEHPLKGRRRFIQQKFRLG